MSQQLATQPKQDKQDKQALQLPPTPEAQAFALIQRQANLLASSTLIPREFQSNPSNCAIAIEIAARLKASPFMVIQNIDIIHGRPSFRASFLIAMVNASGRFSPLQFRMKGEGQSRECTAWAKDLASGETVEGPTVSMAMAKAEGWLGKNGSKWQTMPELMLRYRSAAFFARIYAPDITLGMQTAEEVQDSKEIDVTPVPSVAQSKLFADTKPQEPALLEVESKPLLQQVNEWLAAEGLEWGDVAPVLDANGVTKGVLPLLKDCTEDELSEILKNKAAIAAMVKGGRGK